MPIRFGDIERGVAIGPGTAIAFLAALFLFAYGGYMGMRAHAVAAWPKVEGRVEQTAIQPGRTAPHTVITYSYRVNGKQFHANTENVSAISVFAMHSGSLITVYYNPARNFESELQPDYFVERGYWIWGGVPLLGIAIVLLFRDFRDSREYQREMAELDSGSQ